MRKPRVLVVADFYLPGFRAGGPVRAISNTIRRLASDADFFVVTKDHDADGTPYGDVQPGRWTVVGTSGLENLTSENPNQTSQVFYAPPEPGPPTRVPQRVGVVEAGQNKHCPSEAEPTSSSVRGGASLVFYTPRLTPDVLRRCVADSACDVIWLNSFFSRGSIGVLAYRRIGRIRRPVLLAPRGEFAPGALALKPRRKAIGRRLLQWTGCLRAIHWLASSDLEREQIGTAVGASAITCIPESVAEVADDGERWPMKSKGRLRAVFAARIVPTKNLSFLLEVLGRGGGGIHLDVVGPIEDPVYWDTCRALIARLPPGVTVAYVGEAAHHDLQRRLSTYDVLILPTLGENFGHVVVEAWAAGCPVLLSDRTPWRRLAAQGLGWDIALDHRAWAAAIDECRAMSPEAHLSMRMRTREHARKVWLDGVGGDDALRRLIVAAGQPWLGGHNSQEGRTALVPESVGTETDPCA